MASEFVVKNLEHLPAVAEQIAQQLQNPVVLLQGPMGAGKTTLIKALCRHWGVADHVQSPTFQLVNEYHDAEGNKIYHFDFYRIRDEEEAEDIGLDEYFESGERCLVEWPEKIRTLWPWEYDLLEVIPEGNSRKIRLKHLRDE